MLEQINKQQSQFKHIDMIKNNDIEGVCHEWVVLDVISYLNTPNASIIISTI